MNDQTLMKLVVGDFKNSSGFKREGEFILCTEWDGLQIGDKEVIKAIDSEVDPIMYDDDFIFERTLHLKWLPRTVEKFDGSRNDFLGTLGG